MATAENNRGAKLAEKLNLGEVTGWRLLWLRNELENLNSLMRNADFMVKMDLSLVDQFLANLSSIDTRLERLRWEAKTMLGFDYDSEVNDLFEHLSQYAEYQEQMRLAKTYLERQTRLILEAREKSVLARLAGIRGLR